MRPTLILETTAYTMGQLPEAPGAQIALAGRSNVGKSSLINALAGRRALAKVSSVPGKTRSVNFYRVEPHGFHLVDLPGYGYARASHAERRAWGVLLQRYIESNRALKAMVLLLDARLPPQKSDLEMSEFARAAGMPLIPTLTKADKCRQKELAATASQWRGILGVAPLVTSSEKRTGMDALWKALVAAASENADAADASGNVSDPEDGDAHPEGDPA